MFALKHYDTNIIGSNTIGNTNQWPSLIPDSYLQCIREGTFKGKSKAKKRKQAAQLGLAPPPSKVITLK